MKAMITTLVLAIACHCAGWAQLTVEECYRKAQDNYPLIRQHGLIEKTRDYNLSNARRGYLPQLNLSAQATYQSDVTKIPIDFQQLGLAGIRIPALSQDQYKADDGQEGSCEVRDGVLHFRPPVVIDLERYMSFKPVHVDE